MFVIHKRKIYRRTVHEVFGMQEVDDFGKSTPLTSEETKSYQEDYQKSFNLFQQALKAYHPNIEYHKRDQLKKVMNEALQVMSEVACVVLKEGNQAKSQSLQADYKTYLNHPSDENRKKLMDDIDSLK